MVVSNPSHRNPVRSWSLYALFGVMMVFPLGAVKAQDYRAVEDRLCEAVQAGELSMEQAAEMMAALARARFVERMETGLARDSRPDLTKPAAKAKYRAVKADIKAAVRAGGLSPEEAERKLEAVKKNLMPDELSSDGNQGVGKLEQYLEAVSRELKGAVAAGKLSERDAWTRWMTLKKEKVGPWLKQLVKTGRLSEDQAWGLWREIEKAEQGEVLKAAAARGEITEAEAKARWVEIQKKSAAADQDEDTDDDDEDEDADHDEIDHRTVGRSSEVAADTGKRAEARGKVQWEAIDEKAAARDRLASMQMLKYLALGCHLYAQDHNGILPSTLADLKPYVEKPFDPDGYVLVASGKIEEIEQPARRPLIRQKAPLPGRQQVVAYVDGHVEIVSTK